jgi:hypothetical protein
MKIFIGECEICKAIPAAIVDGVEGYVEQAVVGMLRDGLKVTLIDTDDYGPVTISACKCVTNC